MRTARAALDPIVAFEVIDNGIGFTQENMDSFQTLDSDYKAQLGCRGVGRLMWLKAFKEVEVESTFRADEEWQGRAFAFSETGGVAEKPVEPGPAQVHRTRVHLLGFKGVYQRLASKTAHGVAVDVFNECIWYFLRKGGCPHIRLIDDDEQINFDELFEEFASTHLTSAQLTVKGEEFDLVSVLTSSTGEALHRLHWCAGSRVVTTEKLSGRIPGLHGKFKMGNGEPVAYVGFLTSTYLDRHVRADRSAFDLLNDHQGTLLVDEISLSDIRDAALKQIASDLKEPLAAAQSAGRERIEQFVSQKAPRYRPLLPRLESLGLSVDPGCSDVELEMQLHAKFQVLERETLELGQAVLAKTADLDDEEFEGQLQEYLEKVEEIKRSDLAAYVSRRRTVLEMLRRPCV